MDSQDFCQRCYENFLAKTRVRLGNGLGAYVDPRDMKFECKIPRFTSDSHGNTMVILRDCENGRTIEMPHKEWLRRRDAGEL